jgi:hypothetical protein
LPDRGAVRDHLSKALAPLMHKGEQHGYPVSNQQLDDIVALYDSYDNSSGALGVILSGVGLPNELKVAVYEAYSFLGTDRKLSDIRVALARGIALCPICGISYPTELDHHLPRSSHQLLSVYVRNLVPHCHECNHRKGAFVGVDPAQQFIHAYFDVLPNIQFLQATINLTGSGLDVEYSVVAPHGLPLLLHQRLSYQFLRLQLNERYGRELITYLTGLVSGLELAFSGAQGTGVRDYLERQATVETNAFHLNHWRPVLLRALASHVDFCNGQFANVLPGGI